MSGDRSTAMTMTLLRVGSRGLVALALLFLSNYPGALASVLFARAFNGSDDGWSLVAGGVILVTGIRGWHRFVLSLLSDAFYDWLLGPTSTRQ